MVRHAKRRNHFLRNTIAVFLAVVVAAGALYFTITHMGKAQDFLEESLYPTEYSSYVERASQTYNLSKSLIFAVIRTESNFDPNAKSRAGALGLMQIMPNSFEWIQKLRGENLSKNSLYQPDINIDYGCYLLKYFYEMYGNIDTAVAAYNAGFVVSGWLNDANYSSDGKTLSSIPYKETANYVKKVKSAEKMYNKLYFSEN